MALKQRINGEYRNIGSLLHRVNGENRPIGILYHYIEGVFIEIWSTVHDSFISCFGSGSWIGEKPWVGTDKWKSNK